MAVLQEDKDKNQTQTSSINNPAPQGIQQSSSINTGSQPASSGATNQPYTINRPASQESSGRFTNIQKYLQANQGGGQQIQQGVQQGENKQAEQIRQGVQAAQNQFQSQYNPEQQRLQQGQTLVGQALANPTQVTPDQVSQFRQLATGQGSYAGLNGLQGLPDASQLQKDAQAAATEQGRFGLLNKTFGTPTYNQGQQRLDQLLFQTQNPQNFQRNLQGLATQVGGEVSGAQKTAADQTQALKELAGNLATQATTGVNTAQTDLQSAIQNRATTQQQQANDFASLMAKALGQGLSNPEEIQKTIDLAKQSGVNLGQQVYDVSKSGLPASQFLTQQQFTPENVATADERARAAALAQLSGSNQTFLAGNAPTTTPSLNNVFNQGAFGQATGAEKAKYESSANPYQQTITGLTPAVGLQKDLQSGMDPVSAMIKAVKGGLNPQVASDLMSGSKEFQNVDMNKYTDALKGATGIPLPPDIENLFTNLSGSGGMHGNYTSLAERLNAQAFLPTYQNQISQAQNQVNALQKQYGVGTTLEDLIRRGAVLPSNTSAAPVATGPVGKIGLV